MTTKFRYSVDRLCWFYSMGLGYGTSAPGYYSQPGGNRFAKGPSPIEALVQGIDDLPVLDNKVSGVEYIVTDHDTQESFTFKQYGVTWDSIFLLPGGTRALLPTSCVVWATSPEDALAQAQDNHRATGTAKAKLIFAH